MTEPEIIANSGDILQPMRDDDVLRYRDILAKHLPANLFAHHFLAIQHRWKDIFSQPANETLLTNISPKCMNKFYAPRTRNIENCTFVSISNEMSSNIAPRYCMFVFTLEWPPTELMSCLRDSMHIQWQNEPLIEALSNKLVPIVTALLAEKGRSFCDKWTESSNCVWLSRYEAAAFDVNIPDEYFIDVLGEQYATTINDSWAYRNKCSYNYIRSMLQLNGGLGLFEKSTKRILSWILINDHFAVGCLGTIPSARRNGLARLLVREYCRRFAETEQLDIFAYIRETNVISMQLFESIGFNTFHKCTWVQVNNQSFPGNENQ